MEGNIIFWRRLVLIPRHTIVAVIMVTRWLSVCPSVSLSYVRLSVFSFPDDNLSKCQWIFTKLGVCIDIVEICLGIVNGPISSTFDSYLPAIHLYFHFRIITSKYQRIFTSALILWRPGLGLLMANFVYFWQSYLPTTRPYFHFWAITLVSSLNLVCALILWRFLWDS